MKSLRRIRFIEGDYLLGRKITNGEVITADWLMNKSLTYCDLTFYFEEYDKGFRLNKIIDNTTDDCIQYGDLNKNAVISYQRSLKSLTERRLETLVAV